MLNVAQMFFLSYTSAMTNIELICSQILQGKSHYLPMLSLIYQYPATLYGCVVDFWFGPTALRPNFTKLFYGQEWKKK